MTAIVVDTSAIMAILRNEPEKDLFVDTILAASPRLISAVNVQELGMVAPDVSVMSKPGSRWTL